MNLQKTDAPFFELLIPPGVPEMKDGKGDITYTFEELATAVPNVDVIKFVDVIVDADVVDPARFISGALL
jgi:hypothetical protein